MAETPEQEAAALRLLAAAVDKAAAGRRENGLPDDDCVALARRHRTQADLIEQGVPVDIATREKP